MARRSIESMLMAQNMAHSSKSSHSRPGQSYVSQVKTIPSRFRYILWPFNPNTSKYHRILHGIILVPPGVKVFRWKNGPRLYAWRSIGAVGSWSPRVSQVRGSNPGGVGSLFGWILATGKKILRNSLLGVRVNTHNHLSAFWSCKS